MKTIIAGSRDGCSYADVLTAIALSGFQISEVVSGTARGVDQFGERWGTENGVKVSRFAANWDAYGKSAGYKRNQQMSQYAGAPGT